MSSWTMDFEDERYPSINESPSRGCCDGNRASISSPAASASSSLDNDADNVRVSIRARQRPVQNNNNNGNNHAASSSPPLVVRGAGASAWAVQDAGTVQMLNDECSYLCSALLSARSASQALETALDLARLLSSKKSRNVLWQSCCYNDTSAVSASTTRMMESSKAASTSKTVLDSILDIIASVGKVSSTTPRKLSTTTDNSHSSIPSNARTAAGSPTRSARTKSARRKLKQQQQLLPQDAHTSFSVMTPSWWSRIANTPELSQALAMIVYFLSMDCTLSKEHSAAAMGAAPKPAAARALRLAILQHGKALQGMVRLCLQDEIQQEQAPTKSNGIPSSVSSMVRQRETFIVEGSSLSPRTTESSVNSPSTESFDQVARRKRRRNHSIMDTSKKEVTPVHSSPAEDSLSSLSFGADVTPKASGSGDPTRAGRQNRKRRRLLQSDPALQERKLPAVFEDNNGNGLDWSGCEQILPPPCKRAVQKQGKGTTNLSFTSDTNDSSGRTNESSLFSEPVSPARKLVTPKLPFSPDDSSVASVESTNSLVAVRVAQKLHQLRSHVHFTSIGDETSAWAVHDDNCMLPGEKVEPWVSLVCLDSLHRIITGKAGDEPSCITEEPNEEEADPDSEESNPLLQTNRLLGDSGIIPLLSKVMSQELKAPAVLSKEVAKRCQTCDRHWTERISIIASIIDGACLFNKSNRRSFAEHYDPFSFENDPLHNKEGEGLIYHILGFLHRANLTERKTTDGATKTSTTDNTLVSGARLLALRTLTSLTHDNELAAHQMTAGHNFDGDPGSSIDFDENDADSTSTSSVRGIDILAKLVFELKSGPALRNGTKAKTSAGKGSGNDEESHLYDSTIFCLNTLANIIEAADVRRLLAEISVPTTSRKKELWIQWLCKWLVQQTENFRDAILSIGKKEASSQDSERELEKHEDDKLIAAGNACVLLACLMKEPEEISKEPESMNTIRKLILEQMPLDKNEKSTGVAMIINTLKAFCNYYHFSLGELSMAIVGPVKKLIDSLEELRS